MKFLHSLFLTAILLTGLLFSSAVFADKVNINNASVEQIAAIMTGVGETKAKAIVDHRKIHGKFKSIQDLENVDGIGSKTIEKNKDKITL